MEQTFKPGDAVYLVSRGMVVSRTVVSRVTKLYAFTETSASEVKYSQRDGSRVPRSRWDTPRIQHPTPRLNLEWGKVRMNLAAKKLSTAALQEEGFEEVRKAFDIYSSCNDRVLALKKLVDEEKK